MVGRLWRGWTTARDAPAYLAHLREATFPELGRLDGFRGSYALRRETDDGVEFVVLTLWRSLDDVRGFAGGDYEAAVVPPKARRVLARFDERVSHYEVALEGGPS
jgi:heme-degrading monooxygenase HmoA